MSEKKTKTDNSENSNAIDLKSLLSNIIGHWKLFIITIIIALSVAKFKNGYEEKSYSIDTIITIEEEQNPLFSSSTNIAFNWGGASNLVESIKAHFKSRSHNEKVVSKLKFYINYFEDGKYRNEDVFGKIPFEIETDSTDYQLLNTPIKIRFVSKNKVKVSVNFESIDKTFILSEYKNNSTISYQPRTNVFEKEYKADELKNTPFCKFYISKKTDFETTKDFYVIFSDFNSTVSTYTNINIADFKEGTSILKLSLTGSNKAKLVKYLNTSIEVLETYQKNTKISYAIKTKNYIDTLFKNEARTLRNIELGLAQFKESNNIYNVDAEGEEIFKKITTLDDKILQKTRSIEYVNNLRKYINTHDQYSKNIPAPTLEDINEPTTLANVNELITLVVLKNELEEAGVMSIHPEMIDIRNRIKSTKATLIENLKSLDTKNKNDLKKLNDLLSKESKELKKIPKLEQELIKFERNYKLTEINYNYLKQKSYEAGTAIAANVSDIKVLDRAKDVGQGSSKPRTSFNYIVSLMLAIILPLVYIVIKQLLDDSIYSVEEIERTYKIPVIGVVGKNKSDSNLAVFEKPKSSVAESFRALRSNVQFLFDHNGTKNSSNKTIVLTSSVSGEGKTMISINMATVLALSGKKTILIGLDLRKPKIFGDFVGLFFDSYIRCGLLLLSTFLVD